MATAATKRPARTSQSYLDEYLALCAEFPLVKIETKAEFARSKKMLDRLSLMREEAMSRAQTDYLDMLVDVYEEGERKFHGPALAAFDAMCAAISGVEILQSFADDHGLSGGDIGRLLGSRQLGNAILRGDRKISKAHALKLGEHFHIDAGIFLKPGAGGDKAAG